MAESYEIRPWVYLGLRPLTPYKHASITPDRYSCDTDCELQEWDDRANDQSFPDWWDADWIELRRLDTRRESGQA